DPLVTGVQTCALPIWTREETSERRWEAAPAVLAVIALQLTLALVSLEEHWRLWKFPWWVWTMAVVPEAFLLVLLAWDAARRFLEIGRAACREGVSGSE